MHDIISIAAIYNGAVSRESINGEHWLTIDFRYATSAQLFCWEMEKRNHEYMANNNFTKPQIAVKL